MPADGPTDAEFEAAARVVSSYIGDMQSGRNRARTERLRTLIGLWSFDLTDVQLTAAHDAEKS